MRYYHVISAFAQVTGTLHLTDAQATARLYALTRLDAAEHGENRFTTRAPVGFKAGETFGRAEALRLTGVESVDMNTAQFDKRVKTERETAAAAKRKVLAERQARDEAIRRASDEKAQATARAAAAKVGRKGKGALDSVAAAAGTLFHSAGKPA